MAVFFGSVAAGQGVSSAFVLQATDRSLLIGVASHNANTWFASFAVFSSGPFLRFVDPWSSVTSQAFSGGAAGGWGFVNVAPSVNLRIETGSSMTATTSFTIVEACR